MAVLTPAQIAGYAKGAGWAGNDVAIAVAIALAESSGRTDATNNNTNGTQDRGVWQVNTVHRFPGNLFDPAYNAKCAMDVFRRQGWRAWTVYKTGAYQRHMNAARQGAAGAAAIGGGGTGDAAAGAETPAITYGPPGPQIVVAGRGVASAAMGASMSPLASITLYAKPLSQDIARRVTGTVEYAEGTATVPNMKLTVNDAGGVLYKSLQPLWRRGTRLTYLDLAMKVNEVKFAPGEHGSGQIEIVAIDAVIWDLMELRGARTESGYDATSWLVSELRLAGHNPLQVFLGESVPSQSTIARDVESGGTTDNSAAADLASKVAASRTKVPGGEPKIYPDTQTKPSDTPSGWTTAVRLAKELGKRVFKSGGRLVFGGAGFAVTWCGDPTKVPRVGWYGSNMRERWLELPEVSRVGVGKVDAVVQIKGKVGLERGRDFRSGIGVRVFGTPGLDDMLMMVTDIAHSIGTDTDGVELTLLQPIDALPEPASAGAKDGAGAGTTSGGGADGQIETFVNLCLQQAGDRYVFGAEVRMDDANPGVFDCSELVEWAAWRAGIRPKVPDGSSAQRAHCKSISVEQGKRTKGALLFHPGHVAISLGNGKTIEAYSTGKPVASLSAGNRFSAAGLIPGAQGYRLG